MPVTQPPYENLLITPVLKAPFFVDAMFQKAYQHASPDFGLPLVCFYRKNWDHYVPLCFTLFWPYEEVMLNGGSVTSGSGFKLVPQELAQSIREGEGLFYYILRFGFEYFADECEAFFATCGDPRAWEVSMKAGFSPTQHEHLIVNFHKPISDERKQFLTEKVHQLGSF